MKFKFKECKYRDSISREVLICNKVISGDGILLEEKYYNKEGKLHRIDGPSSISYFMNGQAEYMAYYKNGNAHHSITYYSNGQKFREKWFKNGILHKTDGPAFVKYFIDGEIEFEDYYLNGKQLDELQVMVMEYGE